MSQPTQTLTEEIEAFLNRNSMSPVTFGRKALKDPHFVRDLRAGRDVKLSTAQRVQDFIRNHEGQQADAA